MDETLDKDIVDFSKEPLRSIDDITKLLIPKPIDLEEPDYEENYYNNNKYSIRKNIDNGFVDLEILRHTNQLYTWIADGFDLESYEALIQPYCEAKGINFEEYMSKRQKEIDDLAAQKAMASKQRSSTVPAPSYDEELDNIDWEDEPFDYKTWEEDRLKKLSETFDFTKAEPLSQEEIQAALTLREEDGPLPDPKNISRTKFAKALESGEVDPALLVPDVFRELLNTRLADYNFLEKIYCEQKGIDYAEYRKQRVELQWKLKSEKNTSQRKESLSESTIQKQTPASVPPEQNTQASSETFSEPIPDAELSFETFSEPIPDAELYFEDDPTSSTNTPTQIDPTETTEFLEQAAQISDSHPAVKRNWLNAIKAWFKKITDKFHNKTDKDR